MTHIGDNYQYIGTELETFRYALNYKQYVRRKLLPYMGQTVLEVGAGIGGTTRVFADYDCERWLALEPDGAMVDSLKQQQANGQLPAFVEIQQGIVQEMPSDQHFDTLLYIDVLEHIEHHQEELISASQQVAIGGHIIVLSPAYQFLYTAFDEAIGHYRRYRRDDLTTMNPANCRVVDAFYIDSVGILASLTNLLLLQSSAPTLQHIKLWDNILIPLSRMIDPLIGFNFGRSVICIYQRVS